MLRAQYPYRLDAFVQVGQSFHSLEKLQRTRHHFRVLGSLGTEFQSAVQALCILIEAKLLKLGD